MTGSPVSKPGRTDADLADHSRTERRGLTEGRALVLATGWRLQYRTLACAHPCFAEVHVAGMGSARPLAWSRKCSSFTTIGEEGEPWDEAAVERINDLSRTLRIDFILPSDADTVGFVAAFRHRLAAPCFATPDAESFALLNNKHSFTAFCQGIGVPTPETKLVANKREMLDLLSDGALQFPLVAKPLEMWGSVGVRVFGAEATARDVEMLDYEPVLVQEYVAGSDIAAFYFCRDGQIEAEAVYHFDSTELRYIGHDRIRAESEKIVRVLGISGVVGFDVRLGAHGRIAYLECNPRFWYNMDLTMVAGLNFISLGVAGKGAAAGLLAGRVVPRPRSLFSGSSAGWRERLALGRYLASDVPMVLRLAFHSVLRRVGLFERAAYSTYRKLMRDPKIGAAITD